MMAVAKVNWAVQRCQAAIRRAQAMKSRMEQPPALPRLQLPLNDAQESVGREVASDSPMAAAGKYGAAEDLAGPQGRPVLGMLFVSQTQVKLRCINMSGGGLLAGGGW